MHRHQSASLRDWLGRPARKPLVIRGARQVGKSTLVDLFAADTGRDLITVNLERQPELEATFATNDPAATLNLITAITNQRFGPKSILFLDEIQAAPKALPALRYFLEDRPDLPVIAAGSLLEFLLSDHAFSMPVGRIEYLNMGPMTFTEFLTATGRDALAEAVNGFEWLDDQDKPPSFHQLVHERLMDALREYQFVGGMPEAVRVYAESRDLKAVSSVHASIVDTYRDDFPKYASRRDLTRMLRVFNFAAHHPGRKVKYSNISPDDKSGTIRTDIDLLSMARVVDKVIHSQCAGLPLQAHLREKVFKLVFLDIGLMNAISGLGWDTIQAQHDSALVNAGPGGAQFVGQHLQYLYADRPNRQLTYWLREGRANNAEVDYVADFAGHVVPIEVKTSRPGTLKSLHQFVAEKRVPMAVRFHAEQPDMQTIVSQAGGKTGMRPVRYRLLSLPLYLVERLPHCVRGLAAHL